MAEHLTLVERQVLYWLKKKGKSKAEIAELMGRHRSTIYRELRRNMSQRGYRPKQAQRWADKRRLACRRPRKMEGTHLHQYVQERLEKRWSPDQIAGRSRQDFARQPSRHLSRQTIYNWIGDRAPAWRCWLRRGGRPPERRGKLTDYVRIDGRPEVINRRRRYGDWEGDTLVGKARRSALVTLVERKSGYARIGRADSMKADTTREVLVGRLKDLPAALRRSVTARGADAIAPTAFLIVDAPGRCAVSWQDGSIGTCGRPIPTPEYSVPGISDVCVLTSAGTESHSAGEQP
jgi:IS30 family transposase